MNLDQFWRVQLVEFITSIWRAPELPRPGEVTPARLLRRQERLNQARFCSLDQAPHMARRRKVSAIAAEDESLDVAAATLTATRICRRGRRDLIHRQSPAIRVRKTTASNCESTW